MLEKSTQSGATITIIELITCFSLKKALYVNWLLITNLQLFVYINDWNLLYPRFLQALMKEFRRITLGEFVDDLEVGRKLSDVFGIKQKPDNTE